MRTQVLLQQRKYWMTFNAKSPSVIETCAAIFPHMLPVISMWKTFCQAVLSRDQHFPITYCEKRFITSLPRDIN